MQSPRQSPPLRCWRETVALFALLTVQEARLLTLILGLLLLGLSVRFVHLRLEHADAPAPETSVVQPVRSAMP